MNLKTKLLLPLTLLVSGSLCAKTITFDNLSIYRDNQTAYVIDKAIEMLRGDVQMVNGGSVKEVDKKKNANVVLSLKESMIPDAFRIYIKGKKLIVEASNGRGFTYGLLELSRLAGVSPWVFWGDVIPAKKTHLFELDSKFENIQSPSVEYRGIFINDEDFSLREWSKHVFDKESKGHPGLNANREIFKFLLRMRANAMWPAMHNGSKAFFTIDGAKELADSFGIVIGTSHCEPMLRNNVDEWNEKVRGRYNYLTNKNQVQDYWISRLKETSNSKASLNSQLSTSNYLYTIGMRGIHDGMMEGVKTLDEQTKWLQTVIDDQRELLKKYVNPDLTKIPQVFVPYKEVLYVFENGLKVPDDVELMWCDDNYGFLTRLPDEVQQKRSGGGGIYYHLSYWGRPHDYLWLTATQPGLIYEEMNEAYNHNVRREWIVNVHDVKVASYNLEFFLDMAWNFDSYKPNNLSSHLQQMICRDFGQKAGKQLAPVMQEYYRLCSVRRPEFMGWCQTELDKKKYPKGWSYVIPPTWTEEFCDSFLTSYADLKNRITAVQSHISPKLQDAFYTAIYYPVFASAAMAEKCIENYRDRAKSKAAYKEILTMTEKYNNLGNGRWNHIMNCHPRDLRVFYNPEKVMVTQTLNKKKENALVVMNSDNCWADYDKEPIQMLGHSDKALPIPKGKTLTFKLDVQQAGEYTLNIAMIPTHENDKCDIRYKVNNQTFSMKEPFRSERWRINVLSGQCVKTMKLTLSKGMNTITIKALDNHIVFDELKVKY